MQNKEILEAVARELSGKAEIIHEWGQEICGSIALPHLHPDASILLRFDGYKNKGKVVSRLSFDKRDATNELIMPSWVMDRDEYAAFKMSITTSYERGAPAIARDITRRLLPGYVDVLKRIEARCDERDQEEAQRNAIHRDLCEALGVVYDGSYIGKYEKKVIHYLGKVRVQADVRYSDSVAIELNCLSPELAQKVLRLVAESVSKD